MHCWVNGFFMSSCGMPRPELRNGQKIYATRTRGLTIVDLWPNMTATLKG